MAPGRSELAIRPRHPMRIGLVCPYDLAAPGGVQEQVLGLHRFLSSQGDAVRVMSPGLPPDLDGIDLGRSRSVPGNRSVAPIALSSGIGSKVRSAAADLDVLHVHEPFMPVVSVSALRANVPVVATFHADPSPWVRRIYSLSRPLLRRLLEANTRVVTAVSEVAAAAIEPLADAVDIIPNGVDTKAYEIDVERSSMRVSFLGRDEPRKGLDVLLEAWHGVSARWPDAVLTVMGARREEPGIEWLGRVDATTKASTLASSAVYVAPNLGGESFGIVLVEAMAAGAPVVASDIPAFRSVGGDAVVFVEPGNPKALEAALSSLLQDGARREFLSEAGRARSKQFDWSSVGQRYRAAYEAAAA